MTGRAEAAYYGAEDIRDWIRERLLGCLLDQTRAHMMKGGGVHILRARCF
jgi:hypothetical protein